MYTRIKYDTNEVRPETGKVMGSDDTVDPRAGRDVTIDVPRPKISVNDPVKAPKQNTGYDIFPVLDAPTNS